MWQPKKNRLLLPSFHCSIRIFGYLSICWMWSDLFAILVGIWEILQNLNVSLKILQHIISICSTRLRDNYHYPLLFNLLLVFLRVIVYFKLTSQYCKLAFYKLSIFQYGSGQENNRILSSLRRESGRLLTFLSYSAHTH